MTFDETGLSADLEASGAMQKDGIHLSQRLAASLPESSGKSSSLLIGSCGCLALHFQFISFL